MPSTRSKKTTSSKQSTKTTAKKKSNRTKKKTSQTTRTDQDQGGSGSERSDTHGTDDEEGLQERVDSEAGPTQSKAKKSTIFQSRFPGLELDTYEQQLDLWTVIKLQESLVQQNSRRSKAPKEIKDLVKIVWMEFEKRILMIALMAGVPEIVIWNLV